MSILYDQGSNACGAHDRGDAECSFQKRPSIVGGRIVERIVSKGWRVRLAHRNIVPDRWLCNAMTSIERRINCLRE
jgi:hypothetical protein